MSDYGNYEYRNPEDPFRNNPNLDPNTRAPSAAAGWIAAAVFLIIVLAVAFGYGHRPDNLGTKTAANDMSPGAATHMAQPATIPPPSTATGTPTPPITYAPNSPPPAQQGVAH